MKKITILVVVFVLILMSCSKDNQQDSSTSNASVLPKKSITTESDGVSNITTTTNFIYDGNKIVQVNGLEKTIYTYTGDLITKEEHYTGTVLTDFKVYEYENNKLKSEIITENNTGVTGIVSTIKTKRIYIQNANQIITQETYSIDIETGLETKKDDVNVKTFLNGNLIKEVRSSSYDNANGGKNIYTTTSTYEYDSKNNLSKNILGSDKLIDFADCSLNNVVKETRFSETNGIPNPILDYTRSYEFKYNLDGYPTEVKYNYKENNVQKTSTTQYFY